MRVRRPRQTRHPLKCPSKNRPTISFSCARSVRALFPWFSEREKSTPRGNLRVRNFTFFMDLICISFLLLQLKRAKRGYWKRKRKFHTSCAKKKLWRFWTRTRIRFSFGSTARFKTTRGSVSQLWNFSFHQDEKVLFSDFVMTLAANGEILDYLRKLGCFDELVTRFYAAELVLALDHLHRLGIVHR